MIEWIVWIILFFTMAGCVLVVRYWISLMREKDSYHRDELIDFPSILLREANALSPDGISGFLAAAGGVGLAMLLTLLGGLLSPDTGPEPDWTASQMPNYFFQSALSVLIFHLAWPSFRTIAEDSFAPSFLRTFLEQEDAFFWGMSVALAAFNLTAWGVEHRISFFFVLINGLLLLVYAGYRLNLSREREPESGPYRDFDDDDSVEDDFSTPSSRSSKDEVEF